MNPSRFGRPLLALLFFSAGYAVRVTAQCIVPNGNAPGTYMINVVGFQPQGFSYDISGALNAATAAWDSCPGTDGTDQPYLDPAPCGNAQDTLTIPIYHASGVSTTDKGGCAEFQPIVDSSRNIIGGYITVWDQSRQTPPQDCSNSLSFVLEHELGHVLGLGDPSNPYACVGEVMGAPASANAGIVPITDADCAESNDLNYTPYEHEEYVCWVNNCNPDPSCPTCDGCGDDCSPIMISLDGAAYDISSVTDGVAFDIDGVGGSNRVAWPDRPELVGFLFRDIDGNGVPNNGRELFGNSTLLRTGHVAKNGFEALAEYDSNHDGLVTSADPEWQRLSIWFDLNRDGKATLNEVFTLDDVGVVAFETTPQWTGRRDGSGNRYKWRAKFAMLHGTHLIWNLFYDIYLANAH